MVFSSITFLLVFLPLMTVVYYLPSVFFHARHLNSENSNGVIKYQNTVLCFGSLFFYAWGEPVNIALMLISILFNFTAGIDMSRYAPKSLRRKLIFSFALIFNLAMLGFFKYSGFIVQNFCALTGRENNFFEPSLPIGISFYTFQILSYIIDVYKDEVKCQHSIIDFALYISMFPQLIAGPIVQYSAINGQLAKRSQSVGRASNGVYLFVIGLAKKVVLANTAGSVYTDYMAIGFDKLSFLGAWSAVIFYAFQIYFDFSGYSDMARGLGLIFGFDLPENFKYPYMAKSITEFWRRWHITLSSWFRDYVYFPLSGSRCSAARHIFNLFAVWFLTGLWHGASWNFVLWGLYYFLLLVAEKYIFKNVLDKIPSALRHILTMVLVLFGWVLFSCTELSQILSFVKCLLGFNGIAESKSVYLLYSNLIIMAAMAVFSTNLFDAKEERKKMNGALKYIITFALFFISVIYLIGDSYNPFLYFRF